MRASRRASLRLLFGSVFIAGAGLTFASPAWAYGPTPPTPVVGPGGGAPAPQASPPAPSSGVLAFTGADVALTTAAGAAAIGMGGAFVLVSRRRKDRRPLPEPLPS